MRSQLDAAQAEVAQASDLRVQLEGQLHNAQADNTQVSFSPFVQTCVSRIWLPSST